VAAEHLAKEKDQDPGKSDGLCGLYLAKAMSVKAAGWNSSKLMGSGHGGQHHQNDST